MMDQSLVDSLAELPLEGISREYPNKLDHVINGPEDLLSPRELHPAFYGCYDWHSAVHGHWTLIRLLRLFRPSKETEIRKALSLHLTPENIAREVAYLNQANRESFERPYGWAWLLKLGTELQLWDDSQGREWSEVLKPLEDAIVERFLRFLPKQTYPIRSGVHSNTAFSLILASEYPNLDLNTLVFERAADYYARDAAVAREPNGADFLSPTLTEARLMCSHMDDFHLWFQKLFEHPNMAAIFEPATVSDRNDPQIGHLDGLNFSRVWCMRKIVGYLHRQPAIADALLQSMNMHLEAAMPSLQHGNYNGQHWLGTFALLALTDL